MKNILILVFIATLGLTTQAKADDSRNALFDEDYAVAMEVGFAECKIEMLEESLEKALVKVATAFINGGDYAMKAAFIAAEKVKMNNLTKAQYSNWRRCHFNSEHNFHFSNAKSVLLDQIYKVAPFEL